MVATLGHFLQRLTVATLALAVLAAPAAAQPGARGAPEIRALWVDAFHAGIRSAAEVDALVTTARRANLNTLIVQVRRRGDALYAKSFEPPLDDPNYDPSFDGLAAVIEKGRAAGLHVHAWINAMPVWRNEPPPRDPRHVFNVHGPEAQGRERWLTASRSGGVLFPVGYFLDPGHPDVAEYLTRVYLNVVREYDVDGIHFDYIRYPETETALPRGADVGYNETALARFHAATGRTDVPEPGDEQWIRWRRLQVTNLVRRVALEARALKPGIFVSAATIPWGAPPRREADFANVAPMQRVFQDWHSWLREGLLDFAAPMHYARETDDRVRAWFDGWLRWDKDHAHGRRIVIGVGAYRNEPRHTLAQIARARRAGAGISLYSYASPKNPPPGDAGGTRVEPPSANDPGAHGVDRFAFLAEPQGAPAPTKPPFEAPAPHPSFPWRDRPNRGALIGRFETRAFEGYALRLRPVGGFSFLRSSVIVHTDANGWFGASSLRPGRYRVTQPSAPAARPVEVVVRAGSTTRVPIDD